MSARVALVVEFVAALSVCALEVLGIALIAG